jgi:hypothetical protein
MRQVDELSTDEQLLLIAYVAERARGRGKRAKWGDLCGRAPDLIDGEDAQDWVSRTRRQSTERREALLGP